MAIQWTRLRQVKQILISHCEKSAAYYYTVQAVKVFLQLGLGPKILGRFVSAVLFAFGRLQNLNLVTPSTKRQQRSKVLVQIFFRASFFSNKSWIFGRFCNDGVASPHLAPGIVAAWVVQLLRRAPADSLFCWAGSLDVLHFIPSSSLWIFK